MKKIFLLAATALLMACSSDDDSVLNDSAVETEVTLTFSPYDMEPITRAATSISGVVTHLDVWLYESGSEVTAVHQTTADAAFGSINVTLNKTKTYTLYAVGHKADAAATLAGGIISWPDDKVKESMFYTTTFTPSETTSLSCLMTRIVGQFKIETTDAMPAEVDHAKITIESTATRYNVNGTLENIIDREVNYASISARNDGTVTFTTNILSTSAAATEFDITITFYDDEDEVVQTRTFTDVPVRNGYKTLYRGVLFTDTPTTATFSVDSWQEYDVVEF